LARNTKSQPSILTSRTCMQNNQTFAFTRGYFWGIRLIIRQPHIICAVILVNPCYCVIKRTIHGLYSRKIAPTVSIIHKEIKDSIKISKSKLTLTLIDLGHAYKK
jgi:hypothetical protein